MPHTVCALAVALVALLLLASPAHALAKCRWTFVSYEPSELELKWTSSIQQLQANSVGGHSEICPQTKADKPLMDQWINMIGHFEAQERPQHSIHDTVHKVLSRFRYRRECDGQERITWIEPLAGPLRHPYYCTDGDHWLVNKGYMLVGDLAHSQLRDSGHHARARYLDAGASVYTAGAGGSSQQWLVDMFQKMNISFADISAWEMSQHDPKVVFAQIPGAVKPHYHWFNIPVSADVDSPDNPYTHMKALCSRDDYVIFKLDIDTPHIETRLANQLLNDPDLIALIDEFFFEYHVDMPEMYRHWGSNLPERPSDVFRMFSALRSKGIRAHIWV